MSKKSWKPVRLSGNSGSKKTDHASSAILVELVIHNDEVKRTLQDILSGYSEFRVKEPKETGIPRLVILELDEDPTESFTFIQTVVQADKNREVFLTSPRTDSNVLLESLRAGVKEFFPQPLQLEDIRTALDKYLIRSQEASQEPSKKIGQILSVFGGKGGVGTTTFAVNLAIALQKSGVPQSVVVVEINQHAGDLSIFLDIQSAHSLRDIGADLSRLDTALLTRILSKHDSGLLVLSSGYDDLSSGRLTPECVEPTLKLLQSLFDYVIVDCGHALDITAKKALELSSRIILVSTLLVPVVHRTKKILDLLRGSGCESDKIKLVLNRYSTDESEVLRETEEALKFKASWVVPNDYPAASGAINNGTPITLFAPRSTMAKSFMEIADFISQGPQAKKENVPWVDRLRNFMVNRSNPKQAHVS